MHKLSINVKIIGLFCCSFTILLLLMFFIFQQKGVQSQKQAGLLLRKGNTIALNSILENQKKALDKGIVSMLNSDELFGYLEDLNSHEDKLIIEGMFISLEEENQLCRLNIYDRNHNLIFQKISDGLPGRSKKLPDYLRPLYSQSAQNFSNVFYFRGNDGIAKPFPVEYCGATVITDDDDNPIGFIEVAIKSNKWVKEVSDLTGRSCSIYDPEKGVFLSATDKELFNNITQSLSDQKVQDETTVNRVGDRFLHSDCMPIKNPSGKTVSMLWLTQDYTSQVNTERKNTILGVSLIIVFCLLSILGTVVFLKRNIINPLNQSIEGLSTSTNQVSTVSEQVDSSSQWLAEGSSEQAASIEETSSFLKEMSSMTRQNANNAHQADSLMKESNQVVSKATDSMAHLTTSMDDISNASEETSKIIKTIDEIAFQTNLLALNAAVEAARAGEAGAGFAVVADEVRNLAMRAADAARSTAGLIEGTVKKVNEGGELVATTNEAFSEVAESSSRVGELVGEIAAASKEQAEGIEQVNNTVLEMDKVVQQNAANAEESASASEEMNAQAEQMKQLVDNLVCLVGGSSTNAGKKTPNASVDAATKENRKVLKTTDG